MAFDLDAILRSLKPQRKLRSLVRRAEHDLDWIDDTPAVGTPVLLDTTVYVDVLQGRSPGALDNFIALRQCNHSAVALAELTHAFDRLDPKNKRTAIALQAIKLTIEDIRPHRLSAPDSDIWGAAGILAGLLFRLGSFPLGAERKCLNDALLYLQSRKEGCAVLTGNVRDFDFLNQLVPDGRVLFYRKSAV